MRLEPPFLLIYSIIGAGQVPVIRVVVVAVTVVTQPLQSIAEIPHNWMYSIARIDSFHPLELLQIAAVVNAVLV